MGQMYSASFDNVAVSVAQDAFQLIPPTDAIVLIHSAFLGQTSDEGDAEAEMLRVNIATTDFTINGSGGSTPAMTPHERGFAAAGSVVEANNTTLSTVQTILQSFTFNIQAGWFYQPTPEERIVISAVATHGFIISLPEAPADAVTMSGTIVFEEIGG